MTEQIWDVTSEEAMSFKEAFELQCDLRGMTTPVTYWEVDGTLWETVRYLRTCPLKELWDAHVAV